MTIIIIVSQEKVMVLHAKRALFFMSYRFETARRIIYDLLTSAEP